MSFREVQVHEIREVLRLWLRDESDRAIARLSMVDRKTVKRYVAAGVDCGLVRDGDDFQLTDELIGQMCERVRSHRPDGHGAGWKILRAHHDQLKGWLVDEHLTVVKVHELLGRQGIEVPQRQCIVTPWRCLAWAARPGGLPCGWPMASRAWELQVDFGKMGLIFDSVAGRRRCAGR